MLLLEVQELVRLDKSKHGRAPPLLLLRLVEDGINCVGGAAIAHDWQRVWRGIGQGDVVDRGDDDDGRSEHDGAKGRWSGDDGSSSIPLRRQNHDLLAGGSRDLPLLVIGGVQILRDYSRDDAVAFVIILGEE